MAKITWMGRQVESTEVKVQSSQEGWSEYELADGSTLKLKVIVSEVIRLEGEYDPDGNPLYVAKSGLVLFVKAPDGLKKKT
jgi:hypothetical protein